MIGPGAYDELCTYVRTQTKARGAIVLVLDGQLPDGNPGPLFGFSVHGDAAVHQALPGLLRYMADTIERDMKAELERIAQWTKDHPEGLKP